MTVRDLLGILVFIGTIVAGFTFMDDRHDPNGAAVRAELDSKIFTLNLEIARLTGVKALYDAREQIEGQLTMVDSARRAQVMLNLENFQRQTANLQAQLAALD